MFTPPVYPTHLTSQMQNVHFVNTRVSARTSSDPAHIAWYIGLSGNERASSDFARAQTSVAALCESGWTNHGSFSEMRVFLSTRTELAERLDDDPTRFTTVAYTIDGMRRQFLLEAPRTKKPG